MSPQSHPIQASGFGSKKESAKKVKPENIQFTLWTSKRVSDMRKALSAGTRIVRENFVIPGTTTAIKLVMQSDVKDKVPPTVRALCLQKIFAKVDQKMKEIDQWIDNCPNYDPKLAEALQKYRQAMLEERAADSQQEADAEHNFAKIMEKCEKPMEDELSRIVALRKADIEQQDAILDEIAKLLKEKKVAPKEAFVTYKYYPNNNVLPFRPFGKIAGISESGEQADHCFPRAYVFRNSLLVKPMQ